MSKKIVIIEDEPDILEVLSYNLEREGYQVIGCARGDLGWQAIEKEVPDLAIIDLMLPGMDGLDICQQVRGNTATRKIPIIMVTAKNEESDVVLGLGLGADDYIAKPFSPRELVARAKATFRRLQLDQESTSVVADTPKLECGDLSIDVERFQVSYKGETIKLTATEFRLLLTLAEKPGRVFSRERLMEKAYTNDVVVVDRNIDVHIRSIRKKLGDDFTDIETIRGVGYCYKEQS